MVGEVRERRRSELGQGAAALQNSGVAKRLFFRDAAYKLFGVRIGIGRRGCGQE